MLRPPLKKRVQEFNEAVHQYEDEKSRVITDVVAILESLYPEGLHHAAQHLRDNLNGIMRAKNIDELKLYKKSFHDVLDSLLIDEDVLEIFPCIDSLRNAYDFFQSGIERTLKMDAVDRKALTKTYSNYINDNLREFYANANLMEDAIRDEMNLLDTNDSEHREVLKDGLKKIEILKNQFGLSNTLLQKMLQAEDLEDYIRCKDAVSRQLDLIRVISGGEAACKELSRKVARLLGEGIDELCAVRSLYLPELVNHWPKLLNFTWIGIGAVFVIVGFIFTSELAILALGIAGIAYGIVDLARYLASPVMKVGVPALGKHIPDKPPPTTAQKAIKIGKTVGLILLSLISLAAVIVAIAFPPIAIPMAAVGLGIAIVTTAYYFRKIYKNYKIRTAAIKNHQQLEEKYRETSKESIMTTKSDETSPRFVDPAIPTRIVPNSTDAKMFLFLQNRVNIQHPIAPSTVVKEDAILVRQAEGVMIEKTSNVSEEQDKANATASHDSQRKGNK